MEPLTLAWMAAAARGELRGSGESEVTGVSTDSRVVGPGQLFVALTGDRFDGHDFLGAVAARGAAGAIVNRAWAATAKTALPLVVVEDGLMALQKLASAYRRRRKEMRVIAVTGSNGKTTTKEVMAAVIKKQFRVTKTEGNWNNHIGLPLSVLSTPTDTEIGIFELGINHPGEIAPLVEICNPQIGVITNIGQAHLEFLGDEDGVAKEKGVLLEKLPAEGIAVLNADDPKTKGLRKRTSARVITAGFSAEAEVQADNVHWEAGKLCFDLHFSGEANALKVWMDAIGKHQIYSALYAAAVARELGLSVATITEAFTHLPLPDGRMRMETWGGVQMIHDAYNANPDSMRTALQTLADLPNRARRIAVLGEMRELGTASGQGHWQVGVAVARAEIDFLFLVGEPARAIGEGAMATGMSAGNVLNFDTACDAGLALAKRARAGDAILVKASRAAKLEETIEIFRSEFKAERSKA